MHSIIPYQSIYLKDVVNLMSDLGYPVTEDQMETRLGNIAQQKESFTFLLVEDKVAVGMIGLKMFYYYESDEKAGQISILVIKKEMQSNGYGKILLDYAEQFFKHHHISHVTLTSGIKPEREHAHYFYEKNKFRKTGYRFVKAIKIVEESNK